jgi:hypothetical protein
MPTKAKDKREIKLDPMEWRDAMKKVGSAPAKTKDGAAKAVKSAVAKATAGTKKVAAKTKKLKSR